MRLKGVLLLAATASVGAVLMLAGPASAANLHCGQDLTGSVTLIGNLDCTGSGGYALRFDHAHPGVTLNLNGFKVIGDLDHHVINTDGANNITIKGGELDIHGDDGVGCSVPLVPCAIGIDNQFGGNNLTIAGVKIVGDGSGDSYGVISDLSTGMSFTGGSVSGVDNGFDLYGETGDLIKGNTITPNDGGTGVLSDTYNNELSIVSNKFTDTDGDQTGTAYYGDYDAGTLFSGNTVTAMGYGIQDDEYDAGLSVIGNVMDSNVYGLYFTNFDSGDMISGNYIKNSVDEGVYDNESFNNTYTGNVLTSNGNLSNNESYYIYPDGYGPVTMVNNYARTGNGIGFYVYYAYNDTVPGGPYSLFSGNVATANGSSFDPGFSDHYSVGATWSKNVANYNNDDGFDFDLPWRETVTGNSATQNGGDGFSFLDNNEDNQPLAVTGNSATYNGGYGFQGAYPVAGSGNTGGKTNASGDCWAVAGCS